jgi:hypothetical protein
LQSSRIGNRGGPGVSEEGVEYRGYHLDVHKFGSGWRVRVYGPGDRYPMPGAPETRREDGRDQVVRQAQHIIDKHVRAMNVPPTEEPRPGRRWRSPFSLGRAKKP